MKPYERIGKDGRIKSNPFDYRYQMDRFNLSEEEAKLKVRQIIDKSTITLENQIKKYGLEEGTRRFESFKKRSVSRSKEDVELNRRASKRCVEFYLSKGLASTIDEAKQMVSRYQLENSGVHREYYLKRGFDEDSINLILKRINNNKTSKFKLTSYQHFLKLGYKLDDISLIMRLIKNSYPNINHAKLAEQGFLKKYQEARDKISFIIDDIGWVINSLFALKDDREKYDTYKNQVLYFTNLNDLTKLENYGRVDENGRPFELDHIFSIKRGFVLEVPPEVIGCSSNLRFLSRHDNATKFIKCHITLEDLMNKYQEGLKDENKVNN